MYAIFDGLVHSDRPALRLYGCIAQFYFESIASKLEGVKNDGKDMLHNLIARKRRRGRSAMDVKKRGLVIAGTLLAFGNCIWPLNALSQQRNRLNNQNLNVPTLTTPSRELESLLKEVNRSIDNKQWSEATYALGQILGIEESDGSQKDEFGVDRFYNPTTSDLGGEGKEIRGSLFQHVYRILDELPDEAQQMLEVRHGVEAKKALLEATEAGDWAAIDRISSKYLFLKVGQDARLLIANRFLAQGEAINAASMLASLITQKRAFERFGAPLGLLAAQAYAAGGDPAKAEQVLRVSMKTFPSFDGTFGSQKFRWNFAEDGEAQLQTVLKELTTTQFKPFHKITQAPLLPGGDSNRNADTPAGIPMPILRWHTELHESNQTKEKLAASLRDQFQSSKNEPTTAIPASVAISNGRIVLCSTYDQRIVAIDLQTGLLLWECVYTGLPLGFSLSDLPEILPTDYADPAEGAPEYLINRVWVESIYGNIAADDQRLYSLSDSSSLDITNASPDISQARMGISMGPKTNNVLQCWSITEEGKLIWEVGGSSVAQDSGLVNAYFLGAPLPHRGNLYAMAEINGEVNLVSLRPEDGKLQWKQPLVQNEQTPITNDALLRVIGASPTASGDTILCPTLSGHLIAFDVHSKTLLWGLNYRTRVSTSAATPGAFGGGQIGYYESFVNRSVDLSPVVGGGIAAYAPPDGFGLFAVDLVTGNQLWQKLNDDSDAVRYVGAVSDTCVLTVSQSAIVGLNKQTGEELWPQIQLPSSSQIVGRGVRQGDHYYVSLANQTILKINLTTGESEASSPLGNAPGNLVCVNDRLVSVSPFQLDCYAIEEAFKRKIASEPKDAPQSIQTLMDRGELELVLGNIDAALETLEAAYHIDPKNQDCWIRLRRAAIAAVELDFDKYSDRVQKYKIELERDPAFARMEIASYLKRNQGIEALEKLFLLSDSRVRDRINISQSRSYVQMGSQSSVQEDRWIRTQIEIASRLIPELDKTAPNNSIQNEKVQRLVSKQKEELAKLEPTYQRQKLNHLHFFPQFSEERIELASKLINSGLLLDAEQMLMNVLGDHPIDEWFAKSPSAALAIARLYELADRNDLIEKMIDGNQDLREQLKSSRADQFLGLENNLGNDLLKNNSFPPNSFPLAEPILQPPPGLPGDSKEQLAFKDWPADRIQVDVVVPNRSRNLDGGGTSRISPDLSRVVSPAISIGQTLLNCQVRYDAKSGTLKVKPQATPIWQLPIILRMDSDLFKSGVGAIRSVLIDGKIIFIGQGYLIAVDTLDKSMESEVHLWTQSFQSAQADVERGRGLSRRFDDNLDSAQGAKSRGYWGLPNYDGEFRVIDASREELILQAGDELIALDPHNGETIWRSSGFKDVRVGFNPEQLFCLLSDSQIRTLDRRTGETICTVRFDQSLVHCVVSGDRFLFADEAKSQLRLVNAADQKILLERTVSADNLLSLSESGQALLALGNNGDYLFWNLKEGTEHQHRVKLRNEELKERDPNGRVFRASNNQISVVDFQDQLLVLPYHSRYGFDNVEVNPGASEASFAQVSGSVFAISAENGSPMWEETLPVMQYAFPLHQDRQGLPLATFVRRFNLPRLEDNVNYQAVGFGLVDLRSGKVVFSKDGDRGVSPYTFRQNTELSYGCVSYYSGIQFTVSLAETPSDNSTRELGILDYPAFRQKLVEELRGRRPTQADEEQPGQLLEKLFE